MRKTLSIVIVTFLISSCSQNSEEQLRELQTELQEVEDTNVRLKKRLDSIDNNFLHPFSSFQQTLIMESKISPDSIIERYNTLIEEYPDTFWAHEAQKRKQNVDERREYWENGEWNLPKNRGEIKIPIGAISCPGC